MESVILLKQKINNKQILIILFNEKFFIGNCIYYLQNILFLYFDFNNEMLNTFELL